MDDIVDDKFGADGSATDDDCEAVLQIFSISISDKQIWMQISQPIRWQFIRKQ